MSFTRTEKRKEALREVRMRKRVFARQVAEGRMTQEAAVRAIDLMQAIADDYQEADLFGAATAQGDAA